jgi:hypothetical protein
MSHMTTPVPSDLARALAESTSECMNVLALLASPKVYQRFRRTSGAESVPDLVRECTGSFLRSLARLGPAGMRASGSAARLAAAAEPVRALQRSLERWETGAPPPGSATTLARAALRAFGVPDPPGGWEAFEGADQTPEAERPAARTNGPAPTVSRRAPRRAKGGGGTA